MPAVYGSGIDAEAFIRIWQKAKSRAEVVQKTGMSWDACYSRKTYYESKGVSLKNIPPDPSKGRRASYDYAALARLAEELEEE